MDRQRHGGALCLERTAAKPRTMTLDAPAATNMETSMQSRIAPVLSWLATLAVPVALIGLAVRLVLLPIFLQIEYHTPGFPPDDYGFTTQERLHWAGYAWSYLVNSSDISYLGNLKFDYGKPLYNEREL